jgi:hypothetical protein
MIVQRLQLGSRGPDPMSQGRALDLHAITGEDLRLPVQRKMIGVLGHHHVGDHRLGRQAAFDQPRWCRRLDHAGDRVGARLLTVPAGIFWPPGHDHADLGRHLVEPLGCILTDDVQFATAARTRLAVGLDHHLLVRQVIEVLITAGAALARRGGPERGIGLLILRLGLGERGFELLQRKRQLVVGDALGFAAEMRAADLCDDLLEPRGANDELIALGDDGGTTCALGQQQGAQRVDIVWQRVAHVHRGPMRLTEDEPEFC